MTPGGPAVFAAKIGAGGLGLLVVVVLIIAAIVIFIAMSGSLKRLRQSVDKGTFGHPGDEGTTPDASGESPVSRDQAGPGGAAV